ncbi:hypothetical protein JST97_30255 [bacterium]|nr:hypothetical protein [bacterium]
MRLKGGLGLVLLAVFLSAQGDIVLALAVGRVRVAVWPWILAEPLFYLALTLLFAHLYVWVQTLRRLALSVAVPCTALSYLLNSLLSSWELSEPVGSRHWAGLCLIALGVGLIAVDSSSEQSRLE